MIDVCQFYIVWKKNNNKKKQKQKHKNSNDLFSCLV